MRLVLLGLAAAAHASEDVDPPPLPYISAWDTFPLKSINLGSAPTPSLYYAPVLEGDGFFDIHPTHGIRLSDGSIAFSGKHFEYEVMSRPYNYNSASVIKVKATGHEAYRDLEPGERDGSIDWKHKSDLNMVEDLSNAVLQLPGVGGDLVYVGTAEVGGVYKLALTKIKFTTGEMIWRSLWDGDTVSKHAAWEFAQLNDDGSAVLLAGVQNAVSKNMLFKSVGARCPPLRQLALCGATHMYILGTRLLVVVVARLLLLVLYDRVCPRPRPQKQTPTCPRLTRLAPSPLLLPTTGNVADGNALVSSLPIAALLASTPPTRSMVSWSYKSNEMNHDMKTAKKAASLPDGGCIVAMLGDDQQGSKDWAAIMRLSQSGAVVVRA